MNIKYILGHLKRLHIKADDIDLSCVVPDMQKVTFFKDTAKGIEYSQPQGLLHKSTFLNNKVEPYYIYKDKMDQADLDYKTNYT